MATFAGSGSSTSSGNGGAATNAGIVNPTGVDFGPTAADGTVFIAESCEDAGGYVCTSATASLRYVSNGIINAVTIFNTTSSMFRPSSLTRGNTSRSGGRVTLLTADTARCVVFQVTVLLSLSQTATASQTQSPSFSPGRTRSMTASNTPTVTQSCSQFLTSTQTPSQTASQSQSPSQTPSQSPTPTQTPRWAKVP